MRVQFRLAAVILELLTEHSYHILVTRHIDETGVAGKPPDQLFHVEADLFFCRVNFSLLLKFHGRGFPENPAVAAFITPATVSTRNNS